MTKEKQVYIENKTTRVATAKAYKDLVEVASFTFLPKMNIVPSDVYELLKPELSLKFKTGDYKVHFTEKKEGKDKDGKVTSKSFKDLSNDEVETLIDGMLNIKALKELKKGEESEFIRMTIMNQIDSLEKFKKKGKKKKEV